jgi:hypothetical protein
MPFIPSGQSAVYVPFLPLWKFTEIVGFPELKEHVQHMHNFYSSLLIYLSSPFVQYKISFWFKLVSYLICSEPILSAVTWATEYNVVAVWMNRVQNIAKVQSCSAHTSPCLEVGFFSYLSKLGDYVLTLWRTNHAIV